MARSVLSLSAAYMRIIVFRRHFLQVQQGLVYTFLQLQGTLQGIQATSPLIPLRFLRHRHIEENRTLLPTKVQFDVGFVVLIQENNQFEDIVLDSVICLLLPPTIIIKITNTLINNYIINCFLHSFCIQFTNI